MKCQEILPLEDFYTESSGKKKAACKACDNKRRVYQRRKFAARVEDGINRLCWDCHQVKTLDKFLSHATGRLLKINCADCQIRKNTTQAPRFRLNSPYKVRATSLNSHYKQKASRTDHKVTDEELFDLIMYYRNQCAGCNAPWNIRDSNSHIDHKVPIQAGGTNEVSNLQPLCSSCNRKKSDKVFVSGYGVVSSRSQAQLVMVSGLSALMAVTPFDEIA